MLTKKLLNEKCKILTENVKNYKFFIESSSVLPQFNIQF